MPLTRQERVARLVRVIKTEIKKAGEEGQELLEDLQSDLEHLPGASVAFASRNIGWLDDYDFLEDHPDLSDEDKQAMLVRASMKFEEPSASQDAIIYEVDRAIERLAPAEESDDVTP
jgi:hypothetical protein